MVVLLFIRIYVDIGVDLNGGVIVYVGDGVKALDQFGCQCSFPVLKFYVVAFCLLRTCFMSLLDDAKRCASI